ncbi:MAG TPA: hypothetical protein PK619_02925 [bacterium]|mgnify:FL=1|nr:hypothetical protein [bacterium]HPW39649.1 hypothetical protein [bacterium]
MGNLDWKKIGLIAMFLGAIALFGFFLYYFFIGPLFFPPPSDPGTSPEPTATGTLPQTVTINGRIYNIDPQTGLPTTEIISQPPTTPLPDQQPSDRADGSITKTDKFIDDPAYYLTTIDNNFIYYNKQDGKFYQAGPDGRTSALSNQIFHNVSDVTWSNTGKKAVLEYPDGSNILYDFSTNKQITLPKHWEEFSFSQATNQLAFKSIGLDIENRFLAIANDDGSNIKTLEHIGGIENQVAVNWSPTNQMIATVTKGKDGDRSEVYFIGQNDENYKLMIVNGRDFRGLWSPTGNQMVYSVYNSQNDYKPQLWISDASPTTIGENRRSLNLETWADKCSFVSTNKIYCAVPTSLPYGAGLEPGIANTIPDQIYELDLTTGAKKLIAIPEGEHTISQIIFNDNYNYLLFTDANNNQVYKINL